MTYERVWVLSELSSLFHTPTGITYCLTVGALEAIERRLFALAHLVEIFDIVVQHHFLSNFGMNDVDGVDGVVDVGGPRQDEYAPEAAEDDEEPQEEPVQHQGDDAPVLVLLRSIRKVFWFWYQDLTSPHLNLPRRTRPAASCGA